MHNSFVGVKRIIFIGLLITLLMSSAKGQADSSMIQFSGLVVTADSLRSLPYVAVRNNHKKLVTISDPEGFFSVAARKGDTVYFTVVGYTMARYIIPKDLKETRYSIVQLMVSDTVYLPETVIHPWPTKQEFDYAFVHGSFQDDQLETARKNMDREKMDEISINLRMDANENYRAYMAQQYQRNYWMGQTPPLRILDPLAWQSFFNAWQSGKFKKKKKPSN